MDKLPPIIAEKIHLQQVAVNQCRLDVNRLKATKTPIFTIGYKVLHNLQENRIKLAMQFSFVDEQEVALLLLQIDFHFLVENLADYYTLKKEEKIPVFFAPAIGTLLAIAVSTARGIIYEKLANNGLPNFLIPVINPNKLLQES